MAFKCKIRTKITFSYESLISALQTCKIIENLQVQVSTPKKPTKIYLLGISYFPQHGKEHRHKISCPLEEWWNGEHILWPIYCGVRKNKKKNLSFINTHPPKDLTLETTFKVSAMTTSKY